MSGSTDWLVLRFTANAPNSLNGGWVAEGIARGLKADEQELAAQQLADPAHPGRRWVVRWDYVTEVNTTPGPSSAEKVEKTYDEPDIKQLASISATPAHYNLDDAAG